VTPDTTNAQASDRIRALVEDWRRFAAETTVLWRGHSRSWRDHVAGTGFDDEQRLIQPSVFPAFATRFLGWEVGVNLSPEEPGVEGRPDFTPADPVTHPFVFETKGSRQGVALADPHDIDQVTHYLSAGRPRIAYVVLTNLVGLRVFARGEDGRARELYEVRLRDLLLLGEHLYTSTASAANFARFVDQFSRKTLTPDQKIERIGAAGEWQPFFAVTSSDWIMRRLDLVVATLQRDVSEQLPLLGDPTVLSPPERLAVLDELHLLASRVAPGLQGLRLEDFTAAAAGSAARVVLEQYTMHVAYYVATRLLLVRTWEDLGLLEGMLHAGGFGEQMARFANVVGEVVSHSFGQAQQLYRSLFTHSNNYDWFEPSHDVYVEVLYELAFTYLGNIDSDVLGQVYERLLSRIDRKLLGQYFTPRDVIGLIWDLIGLDGIAEAAEREERAPRVLDIATGSGGFLVEEVARLRRRLERQKKAGAGVSRQDWLNWVAEATNGVEIQYFSRYLAELNLLVQMGQVIAAEPGLRIAPIGVIAADTLSLHQPPAQGTLAQAPSDQPERARRLADVVRSDFEMDVVCGNPPYIGEKLAAPLIRRTREQYPYWREFVAEHQDYLYMFLILGVSKLRVGGRFGFITTEYWLRAGGARPLREYLARNCAIERIVLFRELRLFPDAPGQHSMVLVGRRLTAPSGDGADLAHCDPPQVSIYRGRHAPTPAERVALLDAMRLGRNAAQVRSFKASVVPNALAGDSWGDVVLTAAQLRRRARLQLPPQAEVIVSKGVETTLNALVPKTAALLTSVAQASLGWPERKAGIQLLTSAEVASLGPLSDAERRTLRCVINTKGVYPYAAVIEADPDHVIYLWKPEAITRETGMVEAQEWPLPKEIPTLTSYLEQFRPILLEATRSRKERRPWWTLHRPRFDVIGPGSGERWEPFCLTTRWGGGDRLVVGLAPGGSSPASGLHIVRDGSSVHDAAVLAGIYNSSAYQAIVDSLPPGNLRAEDLLTIGTPKLEGPCRQTIAASSMELALLVHELVTQDGPRFPLLADRLRQDVTLPDPGLDAWCPAPGPVTLWGRLDEVNWARVQTVGYSAQKVGEVSALDSLLGRLVEVSAADGKHTAVRIEIDPDAPEEIGATLRALLSGAAQRRVSCGQVGELRVPVDPVELIELYRRDTGRLLERVERYRALRDTIDRALENDLAGMHV
jgi:N-6 DNA Methylase